MARTQDLMGLGMPVFLAARVGNDPIAVTAIGATVASANQLAGTSGVFYVNSGTSGVKLPPIGGDTGCLLGDEIAIANISSAAIVIFASTNSSGSACAIYMNTTSATGSTGMSLLSGAVGYLRPITVSTWVGIKTSV